MLIRLIVMMGLGALLWIPRGAATSVSPASWALLTLTGISILLSLLRIRRRLSAVAFFVIGGFTLALFLMIYTTRMVIDDQLLATRTIEANIRFIGYFGFLLSLYEVFHKRIGAVPVDGEESQEHDGAMDDADATR